MSTGPDRRVRDPWKWYLPHRAIVLLGVVLTLIALAGAFLGVSNASEAESLNSQLTQRYLVLLQPVRDDPGLGGRLPGPRNRGVQQLAVPAATLVPAAERDANAMKESYDTLEQPPGAARESDLAPRLAARMAALITAQDSLGAFLAGQAQTPQTAQLAAAEKAAEANLDASLSSLQVTVTDRVDTTADRAHAAANRARIELLWSIVIGVFLAFMAITVLGRHALRVEREQSRQAAMQSELTATH